MFDHARSYHPIISFEDDALHKHAKWIEDSTATHRSIHGRVLAAYPIPIPIHQQRIDSVVVVVVIRVGREYPRKRLDVGSE